MARKILCPACDQKSADACKRYNEFHESVEGKAKHEMLCDNCGVAIHPGDLCRATCILDNNRHPNYEWQKPTAWKDDCIQ